MSVTIYHNPRCSKCRQALTLLQERGVTPTVIEYLKDTPDAQELRTILAKLGLSPRDLLRKNEAAYQETGLDDPALSDEDLIAAMAANPILIERPIVIKGKQAVIGRPPEKILEIL